MRMYDLILKKRNGGELSDEEINFFITEYTNGNIPEYQVAALLMAIYFKGMSDREISTMTMAVAKSGDIIDLSPINGIKVDKHSTGGVGDKTTLIIAPIVAACGVKVAKMSGKGLGHTGGTIDKLESIPNMRTNLDKSEFFKIVNEIGVSLIGQTGNLTPADKKLYALRDITATVDSLALIAVSIMSKKIASGSDCILLDVKMGSGAFMKTVEDSHALAEKMVSIGKSAGKNTACIITNMDIPLGHAIGNNLEVIEAVETLKGNGPSDLTNICLELATDMLYLAERGSLEECRKLAEDALYSKKALQKLREIVEAQGGDTSVIDDTNNFEKASITYEVCAKSSGYISHMNTEEIGNVSCILGAGRITEETQIDYSAGVILNKKTGDFVNEGETLATLYTNDKNILENANLRFLDAITMTDTKPEDEPLIYETIGL